MQGRRHARVRELLKRELSRLLLREFPPAQSGLLTVNEVVVSGDLRSATAYVGIVGTDEQRRHGLRLLEDQRLRLQGMLGHAVELKFTPSLHFVVDDAIVRGNRVLRLIEEIEKTLPGEPT
jgi:ribosome-binding factor A